jgi:hypothetical protein
MNIKWYPILPLLASDLQDIKHKTGNEQIGHGKEVPG